MQNVEQIEIVKGGHSVLYGPDAFSGVVNIVPKNTKDKNVRVSQQFGSYASGFWNANAQAQLGNTFLSLSQKQGSYKRVFEDLDVDAIELTVSPECKYLRKKYSIEQVPEELCIGAICRNNEMIIPNNLQITY